MKIKLKYIQFSKNMVTRNLFNNKSINWLKITTNVLMVGTQITLIALFLNTKVFSKHFMRIRLLIRSLKMDSILLQRKNFLIKLLLKVFLAQQVILEAICLVKKIQKRIKKMKLTACPSTVILQWEMESQIGYLVQIESETLQHWVSNFTLKRQKSRHFGILKLRKKQNLSVQG